MRSNAGRRKSVDLVGDFTAVLDVVNYAGDNWLRCWFCGIDAATVPIAIPQKKVDDWREFIGEVFIVLARLLKPGGHVAFEVGEVRLGKVNALKTKCCPAEWAPDCDRSP